MSKNQRDFFKKKNEWSEIKDKLLEGYLPQYFQKLLTSGKPIFYVDCFAGKGVFDDGKDGSPLIAMKTINQAKEYCKQHQPANAVQTCFIELYHAADLEKNVGSIPFQFIKPEIIAGRFEDTICAKLRDKQGYNVFLYIDPYGIRALDSQLFDRIQTYGFKSFEMLINFNSFGFFRDACRAMKVDISKDAAFQGLDELVEYEPTQVYATKDSQDLLTRIAGGDYWKHIVQDYRDGIINGYEAEQRFSTEYKQRLKRKYIYVLDMPIRIKQEQRPKYRMIHVSGHEHACYLMAQNMLSRKNELFLNVQSGGQMCIFDTLPDMDSTVEGVVVTESEVEEKVKRHIIDSDPDTRYTRFIATFYTKFGLICKIDMIQRTLNRYENQGFIEIIREPAFTETYHRKSSFWEDNDSKNRKVIIRRKSL